MVGADLWYDLDNLVFYLKGDRLMEFINNRKTNRMSSTDIKHKDMLNLSQIQDIPLDKVYEWVKTGKWNMKDFNKWLKALRVI